MCAYSDEEAVQEDNIKEGFEIGNVDMEALHALYDDLAVDGEVQCNRRDYSERVGLTQSPISTLQILQNARSWLNVFLKNLEKKESVIGTFLMSF